MSDAFRLEKAVTTSGGADSRRVAASPSYARDLKPLLSRAALQPARSRLLWLPALVGAVALSLTALAKGWVFWALWPVISLFIGVCFGSLTFLAHETMHGAVVRSARWRKIVGWIGFLPFVLSPRFWASWHNRVHHGHANEAGIDPDANPTLAEYQSSSRVRFITDHFAPGRRSFTGMIGLVVGFSIQSAHVLSFAGRRGYLSPRQHRLAITETALGVMFWAVIAVLIGPAAFLFGFFIPLLVANIIVMSFIFTNHSLNPLGAVNDPLATALTVTTPRFVTWLTLGFGFHVEHHLFPWMSARHAPEVAALLRARWGSRYHSMPLSRAMISLHRTGRVYVDDNTLSDPRTGRQWPALAATPGPLQIVGSSSLASAVAADEAA